MSCVKMILVRRGKWLLLCISYFTKMNLFVFLFLFLPAVRQNTNLELKWIFFFLRCLKNRSQKCPVSGVLCLALIWTSQRPPCVGGVQPSTLRQFCSEKEVKSFGSHFTLLEQFREGSTLHLLLFVVADIISFPDQSLCVFPAILSRFFCVTGRDLWGGRERGREQERGGRGRRCVCHSRELVCKCESPGWVKEL